MTATNMPENSNDGRAFVKAFREGIAGLTVKHFESAFRTRLEPQIALLGFLEGRLSAEELATASAFLDAADAAVIEAFEAAVGHPVEGA